MEQRAGNAAVRPGTPAAVKAVQGVQHIRVQRFPAQVRPAGAALRQAGEIIAQQRRAADGHHIPAVRFPALVAVHRVGKHHRQFSRLQLTEFPVYPDADAAALHQKKFQFTMQMGGEIEPFAHLHLKLTSASFLVISIGFSFFHICLPRDAPKRNIWPKNDSFCPVLYHTG